MKIVTGQFNDSYLPIMDGVANVAKNYAYWLNKKSVDSYVITPSFPNYIDDESFEVIRYFSMPIPQRPPYRLGITEFDLPFKRKINEIPFDIVHAHCPFTSGKFALKLARKRHIPIVATFHSKYYDDFKEAVKFDYAAKFMVDRTINFFNQVDFVWTVNDATVETLREYGFKGKIDVIPNGTDFVPPKNRDELFNTVNKKLNIADTEIVFLFVGQLIWQKNLALIINSLSSLKEMDINFKMIFAGEGFAENELREMSANKGIHDDVIFTGKILDREYLKALFVRADLFLFPSLYDTSGIVVQEAAAVKCPSLLVEGSNAAQNIINGYNGFLSQDNEKAYTEKIKHILSDRGKLLNVGDNAYNTLYTSWDKIVDEVRMRYIEIVKHYK